MNDFIQHGGPGSGRYPLGSGGRPYQKFEKARAKGKGIVSYIKNRKQNKIAKEQEEARQKQEARQRFKEANKENVLKRGTAKEVMEYQGELTNKELQDAFTRLNLEANIRSLSQKEKHQVRDTIDDVMKTIKTGNEWIRIGTDSYNSIAKIYNSTPEGRENPLTIIGQNQPRRQRDDD